MCKQNLWKIREKTLKLLIGDKVLKDKDTAELRDGQTPEYNTVTRHYCVVGYKNIEMYADSTC